MLYTLSPTIAPGVLSVRDGRAWARSMHDTIWGVQYDGGSMVHHLALAQGCIDPAMRAYIELMAASGRGRNPSFFFRTVPR
ncbi:MAG TPA: hypothetical protein VG253_16530 [Streptosporangiaceae bacterium]|nr:hypothetical protein [Streptosporangiaceae bacterium]